MLDYKSILNEIKDYCIQNGLDYDKLLSNSIKGCDESSVTLQEKSDLPCPEGLLNETPLPVLLTIKNEKGRLIFEQTERIKKYFL